MSIQIPALTSEARRAVLVGTVAIALASAAASEVITFLISLGFNLGADLPAYLVAGIIPILLAGPNSYWQLKRLEQVRQAHRELERAGSTDLWTGCLNRRAFIAAASRAADIGRPSALLIIDADGLKAINARYGHDRGDEALRSVVTIIREHADSADLIGRIGGGEFGVFLRVATERHASVMAEAIRAGVERMFAPGDSPHAFTVSIGGATTTAPVTFAELFSIADAQLDAAKANGRNHVAITAVETGASERAAA